MLPMAIMVSNPPGAKAMIVSTNSKLVTLEVNSAKLRDNNAPTIVSKNPLKNEDFNSFMSTETNLVPIIIPKTIKAKKENMGSINPSVRPLPWLKVVQIIPAIKNGAGIFVFIIASPKIKEAIIIRINWFKDIVFSLIIKLFEISISEVIITNNGVIKVKLRTLMDWIIAILGVSFFNSLLKLNTKLKWPGEDAKIEDFLSIE
mgnify:CR=1 FL=1